MTSDLLEMNPPLDLRENSKFRRVYLETYGCQMNEYDSDLIRSILKKNHFQMVDSENEAEVVMLNTCSIREHANEKVYNRIHRIRQGASGRNVLIGILGCMATNFKTELLDNRRLNIDFIAGPDSYKRLPELIDQVSFDGNKAYDVTLSEFETYSDVIPEQKNKVNAWIAIMRGCNNFCTFCVVPYTRGRERSRSPENVVEEVRFLVDKGYTQVTLLGQNVNSYFYNGSDFAELLQKVSEVNGIKRIRFTSPHPKDFPKNLLQVIAENDKVCKHIHLPLQAGNDRVLDLMRRTYTKSEFTQLVHEIRHTIPGITLTTDIIVGFPTETRSDFEDTLDVVRESRFDSAFIFKYSERKRTYAYRRIADDVPEEEKSQRLIELNDLQNEMSVQKNKSEIGSVQTVLIEEMHTKKSDQDCKARNEGNKIVIIPKTPDMHVGQYVDVRITDATIKVLKGELV